MFKNLIVKDVSANPNKRNSKEHIQAVVVAIY